MDGLAFDHLTKSLTEPLTRRGLSRLLGGLAVGGPLTLLGTGETDAKKKKKVTLCHQGQTISVSKKAKKKHLKHGDTLGACPIAAPACTGAACVVISQLYTAGANSGAAYRNDYVELLNRGTSPVSLNGWSVQYAPASGGNWLPHALPAGMSIPAGGYFLIAEGGGMDGAPLPLPDIQNGPLNFAKDNGRLALVQSTAALTCEAAACATAAGVVDFVGYGASAVSFEGSGPAPSPNLADALFRLNAGCTDTNTNAADFTVAPAAPRNSSTPPARCP